MLNQSAYNQHISSMFIHAEPINLSSMHSRCLYNLATQFNSSKSAHSLLKHVLTLNSSNANPLSSCTRHQSVHKRAPFCLCFRCVSVSCCQVPWSLARSLVRLGFCLTSLSLNVKAQSVSLCLSLSVCLCLSLPLSIRATAINQARASTLRVCNDQKRSRLTAPMCTEVSSSSMAGLSMATLHALTQRLSTLKQTSNKLTAPKATFLLFFSSFSSSFNFENKFSSFFLSFSFFFLSFFL